MTHGTPRDTKLLALEDVYAAARFLKRCNVRAFAVRDGTTGRTALSVEGGDVVEWKTLWAALEAAGSVMSALAVATGSGVSDEPSNVPEKKFRETLAGTFTPTKAKRHRETL